MNGIPILSLLAIYAQLQCTSAGVLNRTDEFHIHSVPVEELENIRAVRQQTDASSPLPANTVGNVANILTGLLHEDVGPIVIGGTNFIPAGELREGTVDLLQRLSPQLQNALFGSPNRRSQAEQTNEQNKPLTTPPPTHIKVIIRYVGDDSPTPSSTVFRTPPVTTTLFQTTKRPEAPPTVVLRYRIRSKNRTATATPTPVPIPPPRAQPGQVLVYLRKPSESNNAHFPQSSYPESSKLTSHIPDSPNSGIKNFASVNPHLPQSSMTDTEIKNVIESKYSQWLKVVEEAEAMSVPVQTSTTEKPHVYLLLQSKEYEEFVKYSSNISRIPFRSQSEPEVFLANVGNQTVGAISSSPPTVSNRSTTLDPDPRVKDEDDDDDDDKITVAGLITDVIDAILSRR